MPEELEVTVSLSDQKVQFTGLSKTNSDRPVVMDYAPPLGNGQGYTGLELLLISLAGCSATAVVSLLRKMGKDVSGFRVNASGVRRDRHPTSLRTITLEFVLNSRDARDGDMRKAIQMSEESVCPVWAMLKNNVEIRTEYRICH
jgi:putative redox protein